MTNQAGLIDEGAGCAFQIQPVAPPAVIPVPPGTYQPLIEKLAEVRRERGSGVMVAFSSVSRGEGVTYVLESLSWELARQTGEQTLLTTPDGLSSAASARFGDAVRWPVSHPVHRLRCAGGISRRANDLHDFHGLRRRFGFFLVDCPAVRTSLAALSVCRWCDGVVLVVSAGKARRKDIQQVQSMLQVASANVLGVVLNQRVEAVPGFIARFL